MTARIAPSMAGEWVVFRSELLGDELYISRHRQGRVDIEINEAGTGSITPGMLEPGRWFLMSAAMLGPESAARSSYTLTRSVSAAKVLNYYYNDWFGYLDVSDDGAVTILPPTEKWPS